MKSLHPKGQIVVRVIRAHNLPILSLTGHIDPFVLVTTGHEYNWNNKKLKTSTIRRNSNPVWEQSFNFNVHDLVKDVVQFTLWDSYHLESNKLIGQAVFCSLNMLVQTQEMIQQIPISGGRKSHRGTIEVGVTALNFGLPQMMQTTYIAQYLPQPLPLTTSTTVYTNTTQPQVGSQSQPAVYSYPAAQQTVMSGQPQMVMTGQPQMVMTGQPQMVMTGQPQNVMPGQQQMMYSQQPTAIDYDKVPVIDNSTYMLYSGVLYGDNNNNNMYGQQQVMPAVQVQNYPNM
jgi:hypothetical protein